MGFGYQSPTSAKPAGVDVEHIHAQFGGVANHAQRNLFVDVHAAAPAVVHHQRIVRILPGLRIAKNGTHPAAQNISRAIGAVAEAAEKYDWRLEDFSRCKAGTERTRVRIQSDGCLERIFFRVH